MKRIILVLLMFCLVLTGCGKLSQKDIVKDLEKKFNDCSGYKLSGNLEIGRAHV